jgi:hypothetical protein
MFLLSTSLGERGAETVMQTANARISRESPLKIPVFSLPNFDQNFDKEKGIIDEKLNSRFKKSLHLFESQLSSNKGV